MINREDKELLSKIKMKLMKEDKFCHQSGAEYKSKRILELIPEELEVNLYEWLEDKPLTDIYIKELSINLLFKVWKKKDFYDAIYEINSYIETNYMSPSYALLKHHIY